MSKTVNIFRPSDANTFAMPAKIIERILTDPEMKHTTAIAYLYIVSQAKAPIVRIHTGDMLNDTGLSRPVFIEAREALLDARLIKAEETSKQGVWKYEILSEHGGKLPTHDDYIVFKELGRELIEAYYSDRLGVNGVAGRPKDGRVLFRCPFHKGMNVKPKPTLTVTVDGGEHHGRFFCGYKKCQRNGGLIQFEQWYSEKKTGTSLDPKQAAQSVRAFMVERMQPAEEEHPAIASIRRMYEGAEI